VGAGNVLAEVGDPRFDADRWYLPNEPLVGFVEIPAGTFTMGSNEAEDEKPVHQVALPRYWMARYPVTVAQWRAYLKESNTTPRDPDSLEGIATHPVVLVDWNDLVNYCTWLTARLQRLAPTYLALPTLSAGTRAFWEGLVSGSHRVMLPSEAEWERVARYTDGRTYPWGEKITPEHANYSDTQIGMTAPVGAFPQGCSAEGIEELSGNLIEWTRSLYEKYPYMAEDGRENVSKDGQRVLRGGMFLNDDYGVRSASRDWYFPFNRFDFIGFRVCVSPFSL
jgi:formylglycine-generating enzyme required for sulfatase activity